MITRVEKTIAKYDLLKKGDRILVAVSGGADSVALFHLLWSLRGKYRWSLAIAHINHSLRGREADRDVRFVRQLAEKFAVPYYFRQVDVPAFARKHKLSTEEAARQLRYESLLDLAAAAKADKIAVAHNANDQVETVLLFLLRGTGKTGLAGIPPQRGHIVRPLLGIWRDEIEKYLRHLKLAFRTDSSNLEPYFQRNKIRLKLLPLLAREYNRGIYRHIYNLSLLEGQEDHYLNKQAEQAAAKCLEQKSGQTVINIKQLLKYEDWLQRRIIRLSGDLSFAQVESIIELAGKKGRAREIHLSTGISVRSEYGNLVFNRRETPPSDLPAGVVTKFYPKTAGFTVNKRPDRAFLDADKVRGSLKVRTRQAGDRFRPFGMTGTKKLKDYFIEQKIPSRQRDRVPVVVDKQGIVWLAGLGRIDERVKITGKTKTILEIRVVKQR